MKLIVLAALIFSINVLAKKKEPHHFVHLMLKNKKDINLVASIVHIDQIIETSGYAVVNPEDYKRLTSKASHLLVESHPFNIEGPIGPEKEIIEYPRGDEKFHTYTEMVQALDKFSRTYPDITERFSIGNSIEGRRLEGIRITAPEIKETKAFIPGIIFTGSHHAREHLSTEVPMAIIKYLLENFESDPEVNRLISSRDIYIIPMINPDGAMHDIKGRKYKYWRKNRAENSGSQFIGVDLNRNYSYGWGTGGSSSNPSSDIYMGPKPFSEPETQSVKSFIESHDNIRIFLSFHTYSELILYPWGGKNEDVGGRDQKVFEIMARTMSKWNNYKPQKSSDLYIASGDTCDWAYGAKGIFCFTFELTPKGIWGGGFYPGAKVIDRVSKANIKPALYLIDKAGNPYSVIKNN